MNQELLFDDKKSDELVTALKGYWIDQAAGNGRPGTSSSNQTYHQPEINPSLAQEPSIHRIPRPKQTTPGIDDHYLALDGQEPVPVQDGQEPASLVVAAMGALTFFGGSLVLTLFFFWYMVPAIVQGLLSLAGR